VEPLYRGSGQFRSTDLRSVATQTNAQSNAQLALQWTCTKLAALRFLLGGSPKLPVEGPAATASDTVRARRAGAAGAAPTRIGGRASNLKLEDLTGQLEISGWAPVGLQQGSMYTAPNAPAGSVSFSMFGSLSGCVLAMSLACSLRVAQAPPHLQVGSGLRLSPPGRQRSRRGMMPLRT
jgi:hypothetical protein